MKRPLSHAVTICGLAGAMAAAAPAGADPSRETRMLRKEVVVDAPIDQVWAAWTTAEGLRFVSPESNVDLRLGGPYDLWLNLEPDADGKRGSEGSRILAFVPEQLLAFDWTFPPVVPTLRERGAKTQVAVFFDDLDDGRVRVRLVQHGWGEGEDWDAGYAYFDDGWGRVLARLADHFASDAPRGAK